MKRPGRMSIRTALVALAGIALVLAALRGSSGGWLLDVCLAMGLFFFFLWATVRAILGVLRGSKRAVWIGIATFGWSFWTMTLWLTSFSDVNSRIQKNLQSLGYVVHPDLPMLSADPGSTPAEVEKIERENYVRSLLPQLRRIDFASKFLLILNLGFALIGGLMGRSVGAYIANRPPSASSIGYNQEKETP
jgi:hypothetical protein